MKAINKLKPVLLLLDNYTGSNFQCYGGGLMYFINVLCFNDYRLKNTRTVYRYNLIELEVDIEGKGVKG